MTRAIYLKAGGGYDNVFLGNQDISDPMNDEVQIRLHASSLNYHDYAVVSGVWDYEGGPGAAVEAFNKVFEEAPLG